MAQTRQVRDRLVALYPALAAPETIVTVRIKTSGDAVLDRPLAEVGGKGLFTREIDEALLRGTIDLAVHSMKDVQPVLPSGLTLAAVLEREDPRDALVSLQASGLAELPSGAVIGTASLRRSVQVLMHRPDLQVTPLRGNVQTRLKKLTDKVVDAVLLAMAGLRRLNLVNQATTTLSTEIMLPAVAQGVIGIICRLDDNRTYNLLRPLNHIPTALCVEAERAFLATLNGNCRAPIAGLAEFMSTDTCVDSKVEQMRFRGLIVDSHYHPVKIDCYGPAVQAVHLATEAARLVKEAD
ncbi:Porphobilinogen deaminase [invertebrate metagenome]|uniref:hydroxymethylbilane synthase n=1 Tax=invertebrate metagenome TaxID=1711999 RepID=A0A484H7J6_9ZZZZ